MCLIDAADIPFDTFLLDIMLPGTSGIEACREIRSRSCYRATPIIMITSSRAHDIMARAFEAGATDFVSKPFDGLELGTRVNLAAMLSESLRREQLGRHAMVELSRLSAISYDERFGLSQAPGVQSFLELENDLLRKPDALYAMTLFSAQIEDAGALFRQSTPSQFRAIVEAVSGALSQVIDTDTTRFAYAGRGAMIGVAYRRDRVNLGVLEADVRAVMEIIWDVVATGQDRVPVLMISQIEDRRLWSGRSAAAVMRSFQGHADLYAQRDPDDIDNLFAQLSDRLGDEP